MGEKGGLEAQMQETGLVWVHYDAANRRLAVGVQKRCSWQEFDGGMPKKIFLLEKHSP